MSDDGPLFAARDARDARDARRQTAQTSAVAASVSTFADIDRRFARMISALARDEDAEVIGCTAALLSRARAAGHSCIVMDEWAGCVVDAGGPLGTLPARAAWEQVLERSDIVGDGSSVTPLVHDGRGRVYLYRYWAAEQRVARAVIERARAAYDFAGGLAGLAGEFARMFPAAAGGDLDMQGVAAAAALGGRLAVVSGGPGTGKTTTVARILALLATARPADRMTVAAPTGKAAARIGEALADELAHIEIDDAVRARIPSEAATLHRLLGARADGAFRYGPSRRLPYDVVVVDEASMVDLILIDALFAAVEPDARIVLLGDEDQLASVEAGFVFADLCRAARLPAGSVDTYVLPPRLRRAYRALTGGKPEAATEPPGLADVAVVLRRNYRFGEDSEIGRLAAAVRAGAADAALALLAGCRAQARPAVTLRAQPERPLDVAAQLEPTWVALLEADDPAAALEILGRARILCAGRAGPWGTASINLAVERLLAARGGPSTRAATGSGPWYRGRPVMITSNDYGVGLFNGDIGLCWPDADGRTRVWFPTLDGRPRAIAPARLPAHETAWAMTVHKSQGSEFESVVLLLPPGESRLCTRELVYTGLTRARRTLSIIADESVLRSAIEHRALRGSGLLESLREADARG